MEADVLFPNLLTFPILKNGSAADPVGSGRYRLAEENLLEPNPIGMEGTRENRKNPAGAAAGSGNQLL